VLSTSYAGGGLSYTQTFGYDQLNRLTTSQEGASWSQTNSYDPYGNRSVVGGALTFSATNNRITNAGYSYDAAGNLTNDTAHGYTFDAENKISKVDSVSAYVYDGEGQRVRKLVNENLRFIYGIGGQQLAEFDGSSGALKKEYVYGASGLVATIEPTAVNANGTRYTTSDHLGSPRLVTNSSAGVASRHDYMPFGEELFNGGRTPGMGYGVADGLRQKFTSKERDNETGLDYFGARYYASTQGRFTSADNIAFSKGTNPQNWNLYAYTSNNPLARVDPDGHDWFQIGNGYGAKFEWYEGKKHTYKDAQGNEQKAKNVGTHLLVFQFSKNSDGSIKRNSDGAALGKLTLYNQNRVAAENPAAFTGGRAADGSQYNDMRPGVYTIRTDIRDHATAETGLTKAYGLQEIDKATGFTGPWGTKRASLNEWDRSLPIEYRGNYLHGHETTRSTTLGCICDRPQGVLDAIFAIDAKVTPVVKAVVTDGSPRRGDGKPGPYVIRP
jgi:RHS repeat-associated protein